jgi:hypothetical protein
VRSPSMDTRILHWRPGFKICFWASGGILEPLQAGGLRPVGPLAFGGDPLPRAALRLPWAVEFGPLRGGGGRGEET